MSPEEDTLANLAARWYAAPVHARGAIQQQYAAMIEQFYADGWDEIPDLQERLPDEAMPQAFWDRHPACTGMQMFGSPSSLSKDVRSVPIDELPEDIRSLVPKRTR